jgi:hypothetical protein
MTTAKKAAAIVDEEKAIVEQIAKDIRPERQDAKAMPAYASEKPNGEPSQGPNPDVGMTAVIDSTQQVEEGSDETVRMVNSDGNELDVGIGDVKIHERSGWKRKEEEA